ncbi:polyphosphate kinase 1 [Niabella ginsengisoli]|uniref:Polyphosphate kinase n=1 Tax=Niabella ginsengisoli TaxID=522298 RepID=A0ABS9SGP4_9BACT|nr:polyphosphate kinase 1 [Niabella ginsengisoli]MCH5597532.1 polyphosphate kinase 1 [Niabella ginsengisoli]
MQLKGRDISWLEFNERLLDEASDETVPLAERLKFLSIYSSNLDEFSRVRIPTIIALGKVQKQTKVESAKKITDIINRQLERFGSIIKNVINGLKERNVHIVYNEPIPKEVARQTDDYFFAQIAAFLRIYYPKSEDDFFPENNHIYLAVHLQKNNAKQLAVITIPSDFLPRFLSVNENGVQYAIPIEDIIKLKLAFLWPDIIAQKAYSFKVTRDAELDLEDEFKGNLAQKIATQIAKRDFGLVTRLLYDKEMPTELLEQLVHSFNLQNAMVTPGGTYHNLKDLSAISIADPSLKDEPWPAISYPLAKDRLLQNILQRDILLHLPFHNYDIVLRFFNEAALDANVEEISMTMYRISGTSRIAEALITAAMSGKKVTVFVELKARFDEANNISWAKKMKKAGVRIIYSIPQMKVHAKVVLIKRKDKGKLQYIGLLGTGNFNEVTARFYTDQMLMTSNTDLLKDLDQLFELLKKKNKALAADALLPKYLLIAPFNLQSRFEALIDREIGYAKSGSKAKMIIKINNLEDEKMIMKLYEASNEGVEIQLIVRGICRLMPGVKAQSENIKVIRVVDRYLEHGRIFWFYNNGEDEVYLGSADWMTRNLYRRIEVCFPVLDPSAKTSLKHVLEIYLNDTTKEISSTAGRNNIPVTKGKARRAQAEMYQWVKEQLHV